MKKSIKVFFTLSILFVCSFGSFASNAPSAATAKGCCTVYSVNFRAWACGFPDNCAWARHLIDMAEMMY
jgi:hypothetical protein